MKRTMIALLAVVTVVGRSADVRAASGESESQSQLSASSKSTRVSPFACDRVALDPAARKRHFDELGPILRRSIKGVQELPDGYQFQFPSDPKTILAIAEWAAGERLCCPFFDIQLHLEAEGGLFWLRLTGREGTKDFIKVDGAEWIKQAR